MIENKPKIAIVIAGATGVGKTTVACAVAKRLWGEIISADARQLYRGMVIGTAAPRGKEVRHHCIGVLNPREKTTAKWWADECTRIMGNLYQKGIVPIIAGGTGLYIRALVEGLFDILYSDDSIREELIERANAGENLYEELRDVDPESADRIHPNNTPRIIRALEVYYQSGNTMTELCHSTESPVPDWSFIKYHIIRPRGELYRRIEERTEKMFEDGWIEEVQKLLNSGVKPDDPGMEAIGYRQIHDYIIGKSTLADVKDSIKRATRNYAKRQLTWFRRRPGYAGIDLSKLDIREVVELIETDYYRKTQE